MWTQVENEEDYMSLGEAAFRRIRLGGPVRAISFFAPSMMEDYWEPDSEVPKKPFPEERTREAEGRLDWSEDDREEDEELEMQMDAKDIEKMVVAARPWSLMKWTRQQSKSCKWHAKSENSRTAAANDACWIG